MRSGFKKIGFLSALILPLLFILGLELGGVWLGAIHLFVFLLIPLMDFWVSKDTRNVPKESVSKEAKAIFYQLITHLWVVVQLGVLFWTCYRLSQESYSLTSWLLLVSGAALVTGGIGITVAHELGHKSRPLDQWFAKVLLMTVGYMHFIIEHNRGHHVHVATPKDPATSREGENFYAFWWRSVSQGYLNAWQLEKERLGKKGSLNWSWSNQMIQFHLITVCFWVISTLVFSLAQSRWVWEVPVFLISQGILAFTLLELVNYLEHYGMSRRLLPNGRYERVTPMHSWNASQRISNFLLFQLQRHSDHHAFASKPYQILDHHEDSPQLPAGYSAMIIIALFPPLWFKLMNPRLEDWRKKNQSWSIQ